MTGAPSAVPSKKVTWLLESEVFEDSGAAFEAAVRNAGDDLAPWSERWWTDHKTDRDLGPVVFRGSLEIAARIASEGLLGPGAFCRVEAFCCSAWYSAAAAWLVHRRWWRTTVDALVRDPAAVLRRIGSPRRFFVRPDSPLKPFSGRVLPATGVTLEALDHGFYFDDTSLPVIVAPPREIGAEYRYVVVDRAVVAGSTYDPDTRKARPDSPAGGAWALAVEIAARLPDPEDVYILDVCEVEGQWALLELNPFSGADLYACDPAAVVAAVGPVASRHGPPIR